MHPILEKLQGGGRRSIGRANEVVQQVLRNPALLGELFKGMRSGDPLVRMRAADAAEKVTAQRPDLLQPFKRSLLHTIANIDQQEVRRHVAQMIPRLHLTPTERVKAAGILFAYLSLKSRIVRTFALRALVSLSYHDPELRKRVTKVLHQVVKTGSPALKARGRKLLEQIRQFTQ